MSSQFSLKTAERNAVRLAFQDGLWEILFGFVILALAFSNILRDSLQVPWNYLPLLLVYVVGIPAIITTKRKVSRPRVGRVEFSKKRQDRFKSSNRLLLGLVIFTGVLALLPGFISDISWLPYWAIDLLFGLLTFGYFVYLAQIMETPRLIAYGLLFGLSMPLNVILRNETGITTPLFDFVAGGVILIWSSLTFYRFMHNFPLPEDGPESENSYANG